MCIASDSDLNVRYIHVVARAFTGGILRRRHKMEGYCIPPLTFLFETTKKFKDFGILGCARLASSQPHVIDGI